MDKIVFFSESGVMGRIPRDFENARTEYAWMLALEAPHYTLGTKLDENFDLGIVIIPKSNPQVDLDFYRKNCKNVAVMQEGPHWYFQDYPIPHQFNYANTIVDADWIYCHNKSDIKYYKGLGCKDVRVMRTLMLPEGLDSAQYSSDKEGIILGGNFTSWYSGLDSYLISHAVNEPITNVSMGRKQPEEDMIPDIKYLPYMSWREWIDECGKYKVGIHMMRTHAAGTFSMNLAYHGTPCLGYYGLDTQDLLHPQTTVELGSIQKAQKILKRLYEDEFFYQECSEQTERRFKKYYSEEAWLKHWRKQNGTD